MQITETNTIKTLIFFDIFNYPLTLLEIFKYIENEDNILEIKQALEDSDKVSCKNGFYFLTNREKIIDLRFERYNIAEKKYTKRLKYIKLLAMLPYVKMIMTVNSIAYLNCPDNNDIDMAIVTSKNKIWTARFFVALILKTLNLRPTETKKKDRLCPSFFFSEEDMNLEKLKLNNEDVFTKYWVSQFYPVFQEENIYSKFKKDNVWLKEQMPNNLDITPPQKRSVKLNSFFRLKKKVAEKLVSLIPEKTYKKFELKNLPDNLKNMANKSTSVVITDQILKFHDNDIRPRVIKDFNEKISQTIN